MTRVSNYIHCLWRDWGIEGGREEGREGAYSQVPVAVTSWHLAACTSLQFWCKNHCATMVGYEIKSRNIPQSVCEFHGSNPKRSTSDLIASLLGVTVQHWFQHANQGPCAYVWPSRVIHGNGHPQKNAQERTRKEMEKNVQFSIAAVVTTESPPVLLIDPRVMPSCEASLSMNETLIGAHANKLELLP